MGIWDVHYLGKRDRAQGTKSFAFERPDGLEYRPGQFFYVAIPAEDPAGDPLLHHFSFSSSPTEPHIEFTTRMTGHEYKKRLDSLVPGTEARIDAPWGEFVVDPGAGAVAWICGGIGITPARSTIRWALDTGADLDIVLLCANRDAASIAFREELASMRSDRMRVVDVLSHPDAGWNGPTGHVDADLVREQVPDWAARRFFVSGPARMVEGTSAALRGLGVSDDRLMAERFPGYE